jgi:asparagine synthase (glutamine-hydrolysing)
MCGIVGIAARNGIVPADRLLLERMNALQAHRGPDGQGYFFETAGDGGVGRVALAMTRLAIIDVAGGQQPIGNEDGTVFLVANGEIYNFLELRQQLEARGHAFRTRSDCETILHLYEEHGLQCVDCLRGMFAFALFDARAGRLVLVRDRVGEKPLYLATLGDRLIFASEARTLVGAGAVPFAVEPAAIVSYLHWGFVPEPQAAVRGVRKLPAGRMLVVDLPEWRLEEKTYWRLTDATPVAGDAPQIIRAELDTVSRLVVRSDVPVGVCLSAGVDSSVIAALASRHYPGTVHAVSVGFAGETMQDERAEARAFARHLDIPFHDVVISPAEAAQSLPAVCVARDEPLCDPAGVSISHMMALCRDSRLPVMLNGLGGDELFWGYPWVLRALAMTERKRRAMSGQARVSEYLDGYLPPLSYTGLLRWMRDAAGLRPAAARYWLDRAEDPEQMVFWNIVPGFMRAAQRVAQDLEAGFLDGVDPRCAVAPFCHEQPWPERLDIEFTRLVVETYLRVNGLAQSDRLSMLHSVELRSPLVDYRLMEVAIGLRKARPDHDMPPKARFRAAIADIVPSWVLARRKRGFSAPWRAWNAEIEQRYASTVADGYLVTAGLLTRRAGIGVAARRQQVWRGPDPYWERLVSLELWSAGMDALARNALLGSGRVPGSP